MDPTEHAWHERGLRDAVLAGDEAAWRALYDRHFDSIHAYIRFRARGRADWTEDAVQECWLTAVRRIRAFDPERGSFESWLRGIADNLLQNRWRRAKVRAAVEKDPLEGGRPLAEAEAACGPSPAGELAEAIAVVFAGLPAGYQAVLQAKYEEDLSVRDIAARWGKTAKTIESLLSRARAAFRDAYRRVQEEP